MTLIIDKFWHLKDLLHGMMVTATLKKDVDAVEKIIPAGTKVRIVMMSRFGDVGITDQLDETGYCARVGGEGMMVGDELCQPRNPGEVEDLFDDIQGWHPPGMDITDKILHGLMIFKRLKARGFAAVHDMIYAGPEDPTTVNQRDLDRLAELGWYPDESGNGFYHNV